MGSIIDAVGCLDISLQVIIQYDGFSASPLKVQYNAVRHPQYIQTTTSLLKYNNYPYFHCGVLLIIKLLKQIVSIVSC